MRPRAPRHEFAENVIFAINVFATNVFETNVFECVRPSVLPCEHRVRQQTEEVIELATTIEREGTNVYGCRDHRRIAAQACVRACVLVCEWNKLTEGKAQSSCVDRWVEQAEKVDGDENSNIV